MLFWLRLRVVVALAASATGQNKTERLRSVCCEHVDSFGGNVFCVVVLSRTQKTATNTNNK